MADFYPGVGGVQHKGIWYVFQGGSSRGVAFWVGDVGADPPHGTDPGKFPAQGRVADHG